MTVNTTKGGCGTISCLSCANTNCLRSGLSGAIQGSAATGNPVFDVFVLNTPIEGEPDDNGTKLLIEGEPDDKQ